MDNTLSLWLAVYLSAFFIVPVYLYHWIRWSWWLRIHKPEQWQTLGGVRFFLRQNLGGNLRMTRWLVSGQYKTIDDPAVVRGFARTRFLFLLTSALLLTMLLLWLGPLISMM